MEVAAPTPRAWNHVNRISSLSPCPKGGGGFFFIFMCSFSEAPSPCFILEEKLLRKNLALIRKIAQEAEVEFILAFKAFALWKTFPIFREYISHSTASSPYEARLAFEEFGTKAYTYSPAYEESTFEEILRFSGHISFNSLSQLTRFLPRVRAMGHDAPSVGLRINPEYSEISTELYNPCAPGTRFGVTADMLGSSLPEGVEGFHCHNHCESSSFALERTLEQVEQKFGKLLPQLRWLNLGGGHLVTRKDYDTAHLIDLLRAFRKKYPNLKLILEPGSAFAWQTGVLVARVVDIVENQGVKTAILNVSFTCHMPDCLEMPYTPEVRGARILNEGDTIPFPSERKNETLSKTSAEPNEFESCRAVDKVAQNEFVYRLGGNSCLSGDFMGNWSFPAPLAVGQEIIFEDMIHYTTVKTTMFNGIHHPSLAIQHLDGTIEVLRNFTYEDWRDRMD